MEEFGQKLREVRIAKGYTQQTLAEKLYVTRQTVSRWESGNRYPDLETLKKISVELEVSVDELLSMEPHPDEQKEMTAEEEKTTDVYEKSKEKNIINRVMAVLYMIIIAGLTIYLLGNLKENGIFDGSCPNPEAYIYILLDCLIKISVYFIGAVGAGLYFRRKHGRIWGGILIYGVSAYAICSNLKSIFSTIHVIQENSQSMASGTLRLNVLYFVICAFVVTVFCCQILLQKPPHVDNKIETFPS